jgi:hypothetical protein
MLYLFFLILAVFIEILWVKYFYLLFQQNLNNTKGLSLKWVEERRKTGKPPYVSPLLFGLGTGAVFCIMFFYLYHFHISEIITSPFVTFIIVFVLGFIFGYFVQLRNIRIIEG